ncbi:MAG: DUF4139 domain-containing protein [Chloroflexi bacterium]|nr:DUF4139 domain-containing protein [Chloroflexota bacterium]
MRKILFLMIVALMALAAPVGAADQITYTSQPDEIYIFLNNIAFARDTITLPGGVDARVALPLTIFDNTLTVREDGQRVPAYRLRRVDGQLLLQWTTGAAAREITLEYLLSGLSWTPRYDMILNGDPAETVDFNFYAEVQNTALELDAVQTHLIAGRVDASQPVDSLSRVTENQYLAGYDEAAPTGGEVGAATIQYIYEPGVLTGAPGETLYQQMLQAVLPARRVLLWNAQADRQVTAIYKVRNQADLPLAEGIVRSYRDGIFIGSDFVEITPVGSEGSITVGSLQDVRVNRSESQTAIEGGSYDYEYRVKLELTNFGQKPVTIEVVDYQRPEAEKLVFSQEPTRETGNVLRWLVTVEAGQTVTIQYTFETF